ncbi:hypothetical protein POJ06DRAFT_261611 [Lipomyces tetrasporus]|uniref:Uncharacterized protein n=1 Tax=Lipomyces tetrasporus TaxID=54092 RepID=A0AAD7VQF0_9ASCO|nr:uncharacterized protein POJ06DRAFT_261611 [Lipomyces tetrasporus]KAJ8097524.1 hypothetical protein POJ06DRAFT_261611 [Lipomyces tetrasporus]
MSSTQILASSTLATTDLESSPCPVPTCTSTFRAKRRDVTIRQHLQLLAGRGDQAHRFALESLQPRRPLSPKTLSKLTTRRWREKASQVALEKARQERGDEKLAPLYDTAKMSARIATIRANVKRRLDAVPCPELPERPVYVPAPVTAMESNLFYICQVYLNTYFGSGFRGTEYLSNNEYETVARDVLMTRVGGLTECRTKLQQIARTTTAEFTAQRCARALAVFDNDKLMSKAILDFRAWSEDDERRRAEYRLKTATYDKDYETARLNRIRWEAARLPEEVNRVVQEEWEALQSKLEQKLLSGERGDEEAEHASEYQQEEGDPLDEARYHSRHDRYA